MRYLPRALLPLAVVVVALTGCSKKPKLEAKVTGFKPGSTSIVLVHAKATKGSTVWCAAGGQRCDVYVVPASGEVDFEVDVTKEPSAPAKVMLSAKYKDKNEEVVPLDIASAVPPVLDMESGNVSCHPRTCSGGIDIMTSTADVYLPAGSTFQIGATKLVADASGHASGKVPLTPPLADLPLSKLCASDSTTLGTMPVSVTFPDKTKLATKLDLTTALAKPRLLVALDGAKKGPVLFAWESGGVPRGKVASILPASTLCTVGGASDATVKDLRVVIFTENKPRSGTCDYVFDDGTKGSAGITMFDAFATAYERATGKVLGTKLFVAPKFCDPSITTKNHALEQQQSAADSKAIAAWGATLAR